MLSGCYFVWKTLHVTPGNVQKCYQLICVRIVVGVALLHAWEEPYTEWYDAR